MNGESFIMNYQSNQINELADALSKAQGLFEIPKKSRTARIRAKPEKGGAEYTYNYADLSDIREATVKGLSTNGLALNHRIDPITNILWSILKHSSGQWEATGYELQRGLAAQQFGSALTYAKKYNYGMLTGIVAEDDDDGNRSQYESERNAKAARTSGSIRPVIKPNSIATAKMALPEPPKEITRDQLLQDIKSAFLPYMKLFPNADLSSEMMARYGATHISKLTDAEAWDFLSFINDGFQKGVGNDQFNSSTA